MDHSLTPVEHLLRWRHCARSLEQAPQAAPAPPDAQDPALAAVLRTAFPGAARVMPTADWQAAASATRTLLCSPRLAREGASILGATFVADDGSCARVDVLQRAATGWRVIKVRLATAGDEADVDTVAWWVHVASRSGVRVSHALLQLVDMDFVYPGFGLYAGLLREVDLQPVLGTRPVAQWLVALRRPPGTPVPAACPGTCRAPSRCDEVPTAVQDRTVQLEILGRELAARLRTEGHATVLDVPLDAVDVARHRRILMAAQQGRAVVDPSLAPRLAALPWPRHCLRIDTIGFAVPVWPGTKPYEVLPFQWTCLTEHADGQCGHASFLAERSEDPRRAFATTLLQAMAGGGAVLAYNAGFERNRLRELARAFEDLAPALDALQRRIVDVFQLLREHAYHPAMAGSWSFRSVCQAWAPHRRLGAFESAETYARIGLGDAPAPLQAQLLAHGRAETAALQALVKALASPVWGSAVPEALRTGPTEGISGSGHPHRGLNR